MRSSVTRLGTLGMSRLPSFGGRGVRYPQSGEPRGGMSQLRLDRASAVGVLLLDEPRVARLALRRQAAEVRERGALAYRLVLHEPLAHPSQHPLLTGLAVEPV